MSEWVSVLAVFWALWLIDGVRLNPRRMFTVNGRRRGGRKAGWRANVRYHRLSVPGFWPTSWRVAAADIPLALSPVGICNQPVGAAGRPAETTPERRAWRWEELREVGVAGGWVFVNGARFCPDTGHVRAPELLMLAKLPTAARAGRIRLICARWFRLAQVRRRVRVLTARTRWAARLNVLNLIVMAALTLYVAGDFSGRVPARWSAALAAALPWLLLGLFVGHVTATIVAWRAVRKLKPVNAEKRSTHLFSALMLPPQAMRLRTLAGDGFFPARHPLALVLAFGNAMAQKKWAFNSVADLRWPLAPPESGSLAAEVAAWFRVELEQTIERVLRQAGLDVHALVQAPRPDAPARCCYCPRCGDQFVAGRTTCPEGVALLPLAGKGGGADALARARSARRSQMRDCP